MNINDLDKEAVEEAFQKANEAYNWANKNVEYLEEAHEAFKKYKEKQETKLLDSPYLFKGTTFDEFSEEILSVIEKLAENNQQQLAELQLQTENNKKAAASSTFWAIVAIIIALISLVISLKDLILLPLMK